LTAMADPAGGETWVPALRAGHDEPDSVLRALAGAWTAGAGVDWATAAGGSGTRTVALPTYAFQRQRYWPRAGRGARGVRSAGLSSTGHPLAGAVVHLAGGDGLVLAGRLSLAAAPWLADHAVNGTTLLAGNAFLDLAVNDGDMAGRGT